MGQSFAGVLGCIAFFAEAARGVIHGSGGEGVMLAAIVGLFGFAAVGYLCGTLAEGILRDSIQTLVANEVASGETTPNTKPVRN